MLDEVAEAARGTSQELVDTDGDGLADFVETHTGTFVDAADTGTDPLDPDSDGDGESDGDEVLGGGDPLDAGVGVPASLVVGGVGRHRMLRLGHGQWSLA